MSDRSQVRYSYDVASVDAAVRQTNNLLRFANALRLSIKDIRQVLKSPTIANVMWTLIQLTRTYTALKRVMNSIVSETNQLVTQTSFLSQISGFTPAQAPRLVAQGFADAASGLGIRFEAFANNRPIPIDRVNLINLEGASLNKLQDIMNEDAPQTVSDARRLLRERIIWPELSTGMLEESINWFQEFPGTVIFAGAPYGFWVEEGQRSFTGHHMLRDAAALSVPRLDDKIRRELSELIFTGDAS